MLAVENMGTILTLALFERPSTNMSRMVSSLQVQTLFAALHTQR